MVLEFLGLTSQIEHVSCEFILTIRDSRIIIQCFMKVNWISYALDKD